MTEKISLKSARRIVLAAQGFAEAKPGGTVDRRHLKKVLARLGLFQIDSVSVIVRAHYMPLFSRLGPYPQSLLDGASVGRKRLLFEYWAHEASLLPVESYPLMRWRMEQAGRGEGIWKGVARFVQRASRFRRSGLPRGRGARADRRLRFRSGKRGSAAGGAGAKPNTRWNACSGPAASPPPTRRELRAALRPARTGAAESGAGAADAGDGGRASRIAAHRAARAGRGDRQRPARLFPHVAVQTPSRGSPN